MCMQNENNNILIMHEYDNDNVIPCSDYNIVILVLYLSAPNVKVWRYFLYTIALIINLQRFKCICIGYIYEVEVSMQLHTEGHRPEAV